MALQSVYQYRKSHNKCTDCCKPNDNLPRTLCKGCMKKAIDKGSKKYAKKRESLLKEGIKLRTYTRMKKGKYENQ